jgi:hypothetical protein
MKEKTMSANTEKCADKDKAVCDYNEFRRLRYFHGMLLDDKDFRAEQQYHAGKRRLLNRMLHGSGVVCGLDLKSKKDARWIEVTSGFALDCSGNEIWVNKTQRVDLASLLPPKEKPKSADCKPTPDDGDIKTYYIGIRYEEKPTDPVSVYLPSASCEERTCENSRYKEGFCIEVVDCCPDPVKPGLWKKLCDCETGKAETDPLGQLCGKCGEMPKKDATSQGTAANERDRMEAWCKCVQLEEFCESSVECPECCSCDKPCYVVLGQIKVRDCKIVSVCMNECRRYVLTGRMIQHMLLGVFGGSEEYFYASVNGTEVPIPNVGEMVNNPMVALCWYLENRLIKGGLIVRRACTEDRTQTDPAPKPEDEIRTIARDIEALSNRQTILARRLGVEAIPFERSEAAKNLGAVEIKPDAERETTIDKTPPQKPKNK